MWNEVADEVDARGSQSHFYRLPDEFSSVPSDCSSDLKVQNLIADQDYLTLVGECLDTGELWEDPAFPADGSVLGDQEVVTYYFGGGPAREEIEWLRPAEICAGMGLEPAMVVGERDRFDVNQGEIGDCWFLAALANLADDDVCFNRVVPSGQDFGPDYCGVFRFRFFRFGEWVEVCVDDRLPTRHGQLIYLRAKDPNEFWSPLLEKAYAKMYGSYFSLSGGLTIEAAVDFTGGIPEVISITPDTEPEILFYNLEKAFQAGAFMSCSLGNNRHQREAVRLGLQGRHAYTITKVVKLRSRSFRGGTIPLIRLRNPHGNASEWKGDWSDEDSYWNSLPSYIKQDLGLTFDSDGEFYMCFNRDFLKFFGELEIVHLCPTSMLGQSTQDELKYEVFYFHGEWTGESAAGCGNNGGLAAFLRNPQFLVALADPDLEDENATSTVVISLAQKVTERKTEHAIGFQVFQLPEGDNRLADDNYSQPIGRTSPYINLREVSLRLDLLPGLFCIVPTTFRPEEEGDFLVRVFVERDWVTRSEDVNEEEDFEEIEEEDEDDGEQRHQEWGEKTTIDIPIQIEGVDAEDGEGSKKKRKRQRMREFVLGRLKKRISQAGALLARLRQAYRFPRDRNEEKYLLQMIVSSDGSS